MPDARRTGSLAYEAIFGRGGGGPGRPFFGGPKEYIPRLPGSTFSQRIRSTRCMLCDIWYGAH
jgi:hypothetical protein